MPPPKLPAQPPDPLPTPRGRAEGRGERLARRALLVVCLVGSALWFALLGAAAWQLLTGAVPPG